MRSLLILAYLTVSLTNAAWAGYDEVREFVLDAQGIDTLDINAGAGSLNVIGVPGNSKIMVNSHHPRAGRP